MNHFLGAFRKIILLGLLSCFVPAWTADSLMYAVCDGIGDFMEPGIEDRFHPIRIRQRTIVHEENTRRFSTDLGMVNGLPCSIEGYIYSDGRMSYLISANPGKIAFYTDSKQLIANVNVKVEEHVGVEWIHIAEEYRILVTENGLKDIIPLAPTILPMESDLPDLHSPVELIDADRVSALTKGDYNKYHAIPPRTVTERSELRERLDHFYKLANKTLTSSDDKSIGHANIIIIFTEWDTLDPQRKFEALSLVGDGMDPVSGALRTPNRPFRYVSFE